MNGIYTGLRSEELYGSNLTLGGVGIPAQSFVPDKGAEAWTKLDFSSEMGQNVSREAYAKLYAAIYQCNDILELFAEKKDVDSIAGSREMMVAEARGCGHSLHFELLRLYSPAYAADNAASNILWVGGHAARRRADDHGTADRQDYRGAGGRSRRARRIRPCRHRRELRRNVAPGGLAHRPRLKLNYYGCLAAEARALMSRGTADDFGKAYGLLTKIIGEGGYAFVRTVSGTDYEFSTEFIFALPSPETGFCALSKSSSRLFPTAGA